MTVWELTVSIYDSREGTWYPLHEFYSNELPARHRLAWAREKFRNDHDIRLYYNFDLREHTVLHAVPEGT